MKDLNEVMAPTPVRNLSLVSGSRALLEMANMKHQQKLRIIASDGFGWEHVSVSRRDRCPTWEEMCQIKALFWDEDDCVIQYHPPRSEYVN